MNIKDKNVLFTIEWGGAPAALGRVMSYLPAANSVTGLRARNRPGARQCAGSCRTWLRLCLFLGFTTGHPLALALPLQHGGLEHPAVMPPEPPISERCAIVGLAHTEADEEPALVVVHTPFLGLGAGHARQVGLPADVIDQYRAAPAGSAGRQPRLAVPRR